MTEKEQRAARWSQPRARAEDTPLWFQWGWKALVYATVLAVFSTVLLVVAAGCWGVGAWAGRMAGWWM